MGPIRAAAAPPAPWVRPLAPADKRLRPASSDRAAQLWVAVSTGPPLATFVWRHHDGWRQRGGSGRRQAAALRADVALLEALAPAQLTADPIDVHSQLLPHLPSTRGRPLAAWATTAAAAAHEFASAAHLRCHQLLSPAHCEDSASFPPLQVCDPRETSHRHIPAAPPHKQCAYVNAPGSQRFVICRSYAPLCRYCGIADEASKIPTAQNTSHWVPLTLGDAEACSRGKSHGCWAGTWLPASVDAPLAARCVFRTLVLLQHTPCLSEVLLSCLARPYTL